MRKGDRRAGLSGMFWIRLLGMALFALLSLRVALMIPGATLYPENWRYIATMVLAGAGLGLLLTPILTVTPLRWLREQVRAVPTEALVAGLIGLLVGLLASALLAVPISMLPGPAGQLLPFIVSVVLGYLGMAAGLGRSSEIYSLIAGRRKDARVSARAEGILVDSSVIIDGRIADLARTGFLSGPLVVPRFVLRELQRIADADDPLRRKRGRRGLEVLNRLQKEGAIPVHIVELDAPEAADVDSKLVQLARDRGWPILTTDYNLNRVAELQGVTVLNIHDLAQSVRPVVQPGEELTVQLVHEGKEYGQGVGYLDDGTMVVVDGARDRVGQQVHVTVSRLLSTTAGRIIFAHLSAAKQEK